MNAGCRRKKFNELTKHVNIIIANYMDFSQLCDFGTGNTITNQSILGAKLKIIIINLFLLGPTNQISISAQNEKKSVFFSCKSRVEKTCFWVPKIPNMHYYVWRFGKFEVRYFQVQNQYQKYLCLLERSMIFFDICYILATW